MSENKDTSIKLFGKTIQLGPNSIEDSVISSRILPSNARNDVDCGCECACSHQSILCSKQDENRGDEKATETMDTEQEGEQSSSSVLEESKTPTSPSTMIENPKNLSNDKECSTQDPSKKDQDQSDQTSRILNSKDQNPPKKPDKILPCPRCSSMDTKFCYFNNYNVNQPRHFCKNCQRYWTAGGTMRNVAVGAGRRKSKSSSASQHRHLMIPEPSNGLIHHSIRPNGTVLAFGPNSYLSDESRASMLNLGENPRNFLTNETVRPKNGKENSNSLSNSTSISIDKKGSNEENGITSQGMPPKMPCFPYTWNPIPWQPGFPMSFYSTSQHPPQWACNNSTATLNLQWVPNSSIPLDQSSPTSLRKHSREETMLMPCKYSNNKDPYSKDQKKLENQRVLTPKTLRVDDPSEAAKSSIWTTLGVKNDGVGSSIGRMGFFGGLQQQSKGSIEHESISHSSEASSMVLQANPAAFSRYSSFHEVAQ